MSSRHCPVTTKTPGSPQRFLSGDNMILEKWKDVERGRGEKQNGRKSGQQLVLFADLVITEPFAVWPHVFSKSTVQERLLRCFPVVLL